MDVLKMEDTKYTIRDIEKLPHGLRAELIDGDMYMMAPPNRAHQKIISWLVTDINNHIREKKGKCEVYPAPFGVYLEDDEENFVEPDISVICDTTKLKDDGCHGAPDWILEIISPASKKYDCFIKMEKYRKCGVREYWIIDPKTETIRVFRYETNEIKEYTFKDQIQVGIYEDYTVDFSGLDI
ncbi:MAG: Uma2 family endonuclease [Lachnospiraceae bacterium]|nr:Uma2 family endonuclease [Lachnospiraceae bacterium]